jgi:hypothetical protein
MPERRLSRVKEYYVNKVEYQVFYVREDGQPRLAAKCDSPSQAKAVKAALEKAGAKGVFYTENIDVEVIPKGESST